MALNALVTILISIRTLCRHGVRRNVFCYELVVSLVTLLVVRPWYTCRVVDSLVVMLSEFLKLRISSG